MNYNIVPYKEAKVQVVEMTNKPALAKAFENPKIRDYPEEIKATNTANLVNWLLNLIGVSDKDGLDQVNATAFQHVNKTLSSYTYEEIKLAFEKYVNGELRDSKGRDMEVFAELNARVIGKVMRAYDELKIQELHRYNRIKKEQERKALEEKNKLSEEEKLTSNIISIYNCFDNYKRDGAIPVGQSYVYEILWDWNLLPEHNKEFREKVAIEAERMVIRERSEEESQTFNRIKRAMEEETGALKVAARKVVLAIFFDSIDSLEELKNLVSETIKKTKK